MPVDSGSIASQVGASAGLWTHTPVDWRGNEGVAQPGGWPANAGVAIPPSGSTAGATGLAATISAISATGITATGATINYTLSQSVTEWVEYGTTLAYGQTNVPAFDTGAQSKPLTGLTTATLYHYRIAARVTGGLTTYTTDRTFTTS